MVRPYLKMIDRNKRILEIGPLHSPMVQKNKNSANIFYADIRSTDEVKKFYADDEIVNKDKIVDIDYVIKNSYSEDLTNIEPFDYILMSHVIEHIPELISFFNDISNVLTANGKLCLTIPDKRYCFDHYRYPTSFAECYDIYYRGIKNNPFRVLDFFLSSASNDPVFWWNNPANYEEFPKSRENAALECYERSLKGESLDVHFNVFTPESFLRILYHMTKMRLLPFKVAFFETTYKYDLEFNVILEKDMRLVEDGSPAELEAENLRNLFEKYSDNQNSDDSDNRDIACLIKSCRYYLKRIIARLIKKPSKK